jgi:hypothetical protein
VPRISPRRRCAVPLALLAALLLPGPAFSQGADDDRVLKPAEPDFTLVNLPTSLRLPQWRSAFRITHRFTRPLNCNDEFRCPDNLLEDLFGLDQGALIGLEFRIGVIRNGQVGIHRARSEKTVDIFGQYALTRQSDGMPFEIAARVSVEGTNNFQDVYSPTLGVILTRTIGEHGAIHVEPFWAGNTNLGSDLGDDSTTMLGLGVRWRVLDTVYVAAEFTPRLGGYTPDTHGASVAIEKRAGGHVFQLNASNTFATTMGQLARGALNSHDWYLGFNLTRKFY